jgi:hypothetical protein
MNIQALAEARLAAHWAAQLAAAAGASLLPRAADDSHTSLQWHDGALVGAPVGARRAGLRIWDLTLLVLSGDHVADSLPLVGRSFEQGLGWLAQKLDGALARPAHELPAHPVGDGEPFPAVSREALTELAAWFGSADSVLSSLVPTTPHASPVRCWPHHFDIATLIALDPKDTPAEKARTIGVGLSPGDTSYGEPYWYVTPWPYPPAENLPPLPASARWHTEGWVGAVLTASALAGHPDDQHATLFINEAVDACRHLHARRG